MKFTFTVETDNYETMKKIMNVLDEEKRVKHRKRFITYFDEFSTGWTRNRETNFAFLMTQQNYLTEKLKCRGHLFLNEVYDSLGIPRTLDGQVYGWVYDPTNPKLINHIDFGIESFTSKGGRIKIILETDGLVFDVIDEIGAL